MKPFVIKQPEPLSVFSGNAIRLACVFGGRPRPEIRWQRRNGEIAPSRSYTTEAGSVLIVKDAGPEDDDEYICIAENRAGAAKAAAKVQVHCK